VTVSADFTPISSVLGASTTTAAASTAPGKTSNDQLGKDDFLKLLVAQLKYQDPDKPADPTEFMSQTAQFTQVEKLTALADTQSSLLTAQNFLSASALVGRTVSYNGPDNTDVSGVVTSARFSADGPVLRVGDADVPLTSVLEVRSTSSA
jgi:flagellar basal-body rod modification protein FlgD